MEDQDYILFDEYLTGELSLEEITVFEEKLNTDSIFASQFNLYKDVYSHMQNSIENEAETNAFKDNLNSISEKHFSQNEVQKEAETTTKTEQKTKTFTFIKYAMAACVAVLIGISIFKPNVPIYGDYNSHEQMTVTRSGIKDLIKATKAFNAEDYEKAHGLLKTVLDNEPENIEVQLYYAITNIELDNFKEANKYLNELINGDSAFKDRAIWYSALSRLKQRDIDATIVLLKKIPEDADDYKEAQNLLDKLE